MTSTITAGTTTLTGDPDTIRTTGRNWRTAAMACAAAAAQISTIAVVDGFLGDEATTWEQRLRPETSELLSTLATARDIVGGALVTYAEVLEDCQQELRALTVLQGQVGAELDRWRNTPTATPDLIDSTTQTLHDLGARAAAILARHTAGVRACSVQIDRAATMSPSHVAGVRPGLNRVPGIGGGPGRFRQSSNAVMAGFGLAHPAQTSAIGPFLATDNPRDAEIDTDWLDPATRARLYQRIYEHCMAKQSLMGNGGPGLDNGCSGYANSALHSRETLLHAASLSPGLIAMPALPKTTLADVWNDYVDALHDMGTMAEQTGDAFARFMFSGCMEGGSVGACLFDIASAPIPFAKGAKLVKAAVEVVDDGADVVKAGERAVNVGADSARASKAIRFGPFSPDQVMAAASVYDRNGFTRAGRGLQKHSGRSDSVFRGLSTGSSEARNVQGFDQVHKIVDDAQRVKEGDRVVEIYDSRGWGVRMRKEDGMFLGFLEPGR